MPNDWKKYRRTNVAEMRNLDIDETPSMLAAAGVSIGDIDQALYAADPVKFGLGCVARNPKNHKDQWYVNINYIMENFEEIE